MDNKVQIELENRGVLDLYEDTSVDITMSIKDVREPLGFIYDHSKTITLPATKTNKRVLGLIDGHNLEVGDIDPKQHHKAYFVLNGSKIKGGFLTITSVIRNGEDKIREIECEYVHSIIGIKEELENVSLFQLTELDQYNHQKTRGNIIDSWSDDESDIGKGFVYPIIDYGGREDYGTFKEVDLKPAVYAKELLDIIIKDRGGFDYKSDFLESDVFKRMIVPSVGREELSREEEECIRASASLEENFGVPSEITDLRDIDGTNLNIVSDSNYMEEYHWFSDLSIPLSNNMWENKKIEQWKDDDDSDREGSDDKDHDSCENMETPIGEYQAPLAGQYKVNAHIRPYVFLTWENGSYDSITTSPANFAPSRGAGYDLDLSNIKLRLYKRFNDGTVKLVDNEEEFYQPNVYAETVGGVTNQFNDPDNDLGNSLDDGWLTMKRIGSGGGDESELFIKYENLKSFDGWPIIKLETAVNLDEGEEIFLRASHYMHGETLVDDNLVEYNLPGPGFIGFNYWMQGGPNDDPGPPDPEFVPWKMFFTLDPWDQDASGRPANFFEVQHESHQALGAGATIDLKSSMPDMTCSEFVEDIFKMYNLFTIEEEPGVLRIEPFKDMFNIGTVRDWSDRVDFDSEQTYELYTELAKRYIFTYSEGSDVKNEKYLKKNNERVYGEREVKIDADVGEDEQELELNAVPSPLWQIGNVVLTQYFGDTNKDSRTGFDRYTDREAHYLFYRYIPRPFSNIAGWDFKYKDPDNSWSGITETRSDLPYAGHIDNIQYPRFDLNFNKVYNEAFSQDQITEGDLYKRFHKHWLDNIKHPDSHLLTTNIVLDHKEFEELSLNDTILINGNKYIVNKINNIDLTDLGSSVEMELLHMPILDTSQSIAGAVWTTSDGSVVDPVNDPTIPANVEPAEGQLEPGSVSSSVNTEQVTLDGNIVPQLSNNNLQGINNVIAGNSLDNNIQGSNNQIISSDANNVQGDNNEIEEDSELVNVQGDNNTISNSVEGSLISGYNNEVQNNTSNVVVAGNNNTVSGNSSNIYIMGNDNEVEPNTTMAVGIGISGATIDQSDTFYVNNLQVIGNITGAGALNTCSGLTTDFISACTANQITIMNNVGLGADTQSSGTISFAGGEATTGDVISDGNTSFNFSRVTSAGVGGVEGDESAILAGRDHTIDVNSIRSAIIGGDGSQIDNSDNSSILGGNNTTLNGVSNTYTLGGDSNQNEGSINTFIMGGTTNGVINADVSAIISSANSSMTEGTGSPGSLTRSVIIGGSDNTIEGDVLNSGYTSQNNIILGGNNNTISTNGVGQAEGNSLNNGIIASENTEIIEGEEIAAIGSFNQVISTGGIGAQNNTLFAGGNLFQGVASSSGVQTGSLMTQSLHFGDSAFFTSSALQDDFITKVNVSSYLELNGNNTNLDHRFLVVENFNNPGSGSDIDIEFTDGTTFTTNQSSIATVPPGETVIIITQSAIVGTACIIGEHA